MAQITKQSIITQIKPYIYIVCAVGKLWDMAVGKPHATPSSLLSKIGLLINQI